MSGTNDDLPNAQDGEKEGEADPSSLDSEEQVAPEVLDAVHYYYERQKLRTERCPQCRSDLFLVQRVSAACPKCGRRWNKEELTSLTQEDVARLLETATYRPSRSEIQRLLAQADEQKISKMHIASPFPDRLLRQMELDLRAHFALKEVHVVRGRDELFDEHIELAEGVKRELRTAVLERAGIPAAEMVIEVLEQAIKGRDPKSFELEKPKATLCLSWGFSVSRVVQELRPNRAMPEVAVVPFVGALTAHPFSEMHDCNLLVQRAAQTLLSEKHALWLPSPAFVRGKELREAIDDSPLVKEVLEAARVADMVVVSVGHPDARRSTLARSNLLKREEIEKKIIDGAIGEIGGHYFNKRGGTVDGIQPVGLNLEDLKNIVRDVRLVLAVVAGDINRIEPLFWALKSKMINALVTDHLTAMRLLNRP